MNASAVEFLSDLGRRILSYSGDEKAESFLFQRSSIALQHYCCMRASLEPTFRTSSHSRLFLIFFAFNLRDLNCPGCLKIIIQALVWRITPANMMNLRRRQLLDGEVDGSEV